VRVLDDIYSEMIAVATESKYGGVDMTGEGDFSDDDDDEDHDDDDEDSCDGGVLQMDQDQDQQRLVVHEQVRRELDGYKNLPDLPAVHKRKNGHAKRKNGRPKPTDPLQWWKKKQDQFPILAKLARVYLAVPATSAPSERVFSKANHIISKTRCRLDPAKAGRMIWLSSMIKNSR
jgi:hypothetical protein